MNKIIAVLIVVLMSFSVEAKEKVITPECELIGELAKVMMQARQHGMPMNALIEMTEGNKLALIVLQSAYEQPRYSSYTAIQESVRNFKDMWALECVKIQSE